jgi:transcriptional regulator with XRE-family HTH domain
MSVSATVRRRRLAAELRHLRERSGLTLEEAAAQVEISKSALSRIETTKSGARVPIVRVLLQLYGVGPETTESLIQLTREARQRGWWHQYTAAMPQGFEEFLGFEEEASERLQFSVMLVPGLLQTRKYAEAVLGEYGPGLSQDVIRQRVELRLSRQAILQRADRFESWFVIDEGALRRVVGGRAVMTGQLRHLAGLMASKQVNVQILPLTAGAYPAMEGPFTVFRFAVDPAVVQIELLNSSVYLEEPAKVRQYCQAFDRIRATAASLKQSESIINDVLKEALREDPDGIGD